MNKYIGFSGLQSKLSKGTKTVVLVHGIFDILHKGHIILFSEAKKLGDLLVVGVDTDNNAKTLKGKNRPFNKFDARVFVLSHIEDIDFIFKISDFPTDGDVSDFYLDIYRKLKPDVLATNLEIGKYGYHKKKQAKQLGIKFVNLSEVYHPRPTELL